MNLAQQIVLVIGAAAIATVVAVHGTEYVSYNVDAHVSLARHAVQGLAAAAWTAVGFLVFRRTK